MTLFGLYPTGLISIDIIYTYKFLILRISSRRETIIHTPHNPPIEQRTTDTFLKRSSIHPLSTQLKFSIPLRCMATHYMEGHLPRKLALSRSNSIRYYGQDISMKCLKHTTSPVDLTHRSYHEQTEGHQLHWTFQWIHSHSYVQGLAQIPLVGRTWTLHISLVISIYPHITPHWYNNVHFGPRRSCHCIWTLPKRPHINGDIAHTYK